MPFWDKFGSKWKNLATKWVPQWYPLIHIQFIRYPTVYQHSTTAIQKLPIICNHLPRHLIVIQVCRLYATSYSWLVTKYDFATPILRLDPSHRQHWRKALQYSVLDRPVHVSRLTSIGLSDGGKVAHIRNLTQGPDGIDEDQVDDADKSELRLSQDIVSQNQDCVFITDHINCTYTTGGNETLMNK